MKRVTMLFAAGFILLAAATLPTMRAGAQQTVVTDDNLDQMITSAKTPADHQAIAVFFEQEAADAKQKADLHRRTAETYRKMKISKPVYMAEMCDGIAAMWDKIAVDDSNLAKAHTGTWPRRSVAKLDVHSAVGWWQDCRLAHQHRIIEHDRYHGKQHPKEPTLPTLHAYGFDNGGGRRYICDTKFRWSLQVPIGA